MSTGVVIRLENLPNSAGTSDIRQFFNGLSIPDGGVHIIGGEDGTAFILFSTDEDARQAMQRDSQKISGDKVKLLLSSHTEMRNMIEESQRKYEELRGLRPPEPPINNFTIRSSAAGTNVPKGQVLEVEGNDLYVELKGMPENVSEEELVEFFHGLPISAIRLPLDENGAQIGQGFVRFRSQSSKVMALKKDRDFLGPRFVRVLPALERQWVATANSQMCCTWRPAPEYPSRKRGKSNTPSNEGTPKRSRAFSPLRFDNCVELRGLPPSVTTKTVQELFYHLEFSENGLYIESDGKACRGRAFAEFTSVDHYKEALLKDGEVLEGKQIRVITISRQGMSDCIKHNKKYLKMKREEEHKREKEELERKEREKQHKEAQERQLKEIEQKRSDEEQRKRREHHLKKKEMEEWLARQHEKEEAERKRQERDRRLEEERRMRAAEDERMRREEERRRRDDEIRRQEEARRHEYEMKRQREIDEMELRMKEEEKRRIKEELLKEELASMTNGSNKETVEMELESPPRVDDLSEHYPPPPSDALLPKNPAPPRYSVASTKEEGEYTSYSPTLGQRPRADESMHPPPPTSYPYERRHSPPPLPHIPRDRPPPIPPHAIPGIPPPAIVTPGPPRIPASIPPPPLPPAIPVMRMPNTDMGIDPFRPPVIAPPAKPPVSMVRMAPPIGPITVPPPVIVPPPTSSHQSESGGPAKSVYCRLANAPYQVTENQVREFFKPAGVSPIAVEFLGKDGKRSGHIFVKFSNENDAEKATTLDQKSLGGRDTLVRLTYVSYMQQALRRFDTRDFEDLFKHDPKKDNLDLARDIFRERLTCVRIANLPPTTITQDILRAFSGVGILPNGVHILKSADGKCNGSAFLEVITPEDCLRAADLHAVASINGSLIRVMPLKLQDMDREIHQHHDSVFGRNPMPGLPPVMPNHSIRPHMPVPPPIPPPHGAPRHPPPIRMDDMRIPHMPPMPPRNRSPPPHHMNHRPNSPSRGPPRPRSPPRGPPGRPISPPLGPRSRDMFIHEEMAHRAQLQDIERRIEQERMKMHDMGPYGDRGPRFDRPGEGPYFPPGLPPRLPPPHFMGDGLWRGRHPHPADMPRFRLPHSSAAVKMSNLSFHVTQEDILEFFMKYVPIPDSVRLMYNQSGRLTGEGFVAFPDRETANRAIRELDKKTLLQRPIKLYMT